MTHTAILFDLDGTLLNSLDDLADSMNIVLTTLGFPIHPVDAYRYFVGNYLRSGRYRLAPRSVNSSMYSRGSIGPESTNYHPLQTHLSWVRPTFIDPQSALCPAVLRRRNLVDLPEHFRKIERVRETHHLGYDF